MAFIAFGVQFSIWFFGAIIVLSIVGHFIPFVKLHRWKFNALCILMGAAIGYVQGVGQIMNWAESQMKSIREEQALAGKEVGYFLADSLPALKLVHARIPPEMLAEVDRLYRDGPPCTRAHVDKLRGANIDVAAVCSSTATK